MPIPLVPARSPLLRNQGDTEPGKRNLPLPPPVPAGQAPPPAIPVWEIVPPTVRLSKRAPSPSALPRGLLAMAPQCGASPLRGHRPYDRAADDAGRGARGGREREGGPEVPR